MAVWRGFEDSRAGVWLAEHTGLLAALSREGSVLVRRLAVGVLLVAMAFTLLLFAAAGGDPVAGGLLSMPFWMAALAVCAVLWAFWDAYRDSGNGSWIACRRLRAWPRVVRSRPRAGCAR
ncbi:MAG: hypothetical protein ACLUNV_00195 [Sutterella wadsworthensis]